MDAILFGIEPGSLYYAFSNYAPYSVDIDGETWPTVDHYIYASATNDIGVQQTIRTGTVSEARRIIWAMASAGTLIPEWKTHLLEAAKRALRAKFTQYDDLRLTLINTGNTPLIYNTPHDAYWGSGPITTGENHLGVLLMQIRAELQAEQDKTENCIY